MSFNRVRPLLLCALMCGMVAVPVRVLAQTPQAASSDANAPVTSKGQEDSLKNEEKANKQRAKAAKEQRKALRAQDKAAKAEKKAGVSPAATTTPQ
ncbi:hypothetical protein [Terriglobus aquaticus]|uniref:Uncharacterized protein n=1 Tax=Terriglobus aquaticus TaxID=940139 RepID=A0ABW9KMS2_9BACT|nr:hypothetical protein [Terriglobus aquaticus]